MTAFPDGAMIEVSPATGRRRVLVTSVSASIWADDSYRVFINRTSLLKGSIIKNQVPLSAINRDLMCS